MHRHVRSRCKAASDPDGEEQVQALALRRQQEEQQRQLTALVAAQVAAQLAELLQAKPAPVAEMHIGQLNTGPVTNISQQVNTIVQVVVPWDSDDRIRIGIAQVIAAFAENARLQEYLRLDTRLQSDQEIAPPYVTEFFMDLTKRGHSDPAARNVHLNPVRADQTKVLLASGQWEVRSLQETSRSVLDGVAQQTGRIFRTPAELRQLPVEAQNALALTRMLYNYEPEEYVNRVKPQMAAHLANMVPGASDK